MKLFLVFVLYIVAPGAIVAQHVEIVKELPGVSLRGLSVVTDDIIWVSGNKGTVGRSIDGGRTWSWTVVRNFEMRDFRDIEAFNDKKAVIIAVAEPAVILRTEDGGVSWQSVYENNTKGMFLDAIDFSDDLNGTVVGDPISKKFFLASTHDGGATWLENKTPFSIADSTEGCFASSGTNIRMIGSFPVFVSGGIRSKVYWKNQAFDLPFLQGQATVGANSIAVKENKGSSLWIVTGGDFKQDSLKSNNCFLTINRGESWTKPALGPTGYRSCVEFISGENFIACGLNGVDISTDNGNVWKKISSTGFHACRKAKHGKAVFLSGNARIGKIIP